MAKSNAQRGQYFKARTKAWLEKSGYLVAHLERVMWIHSPKGRIPIKRDQLGADLLATSQTETIYIQVKGGSSSASNLSAAVREFKKYQVAGKQWVVLWEPRARTPRVVDVETYKVNTGQIQAPPQKKALGRARTPEETLF